ncbi:MAG: transcriptional repressor [Gammaproteobacteria bacterium]|nr:transcriptional repressor [Gammaproteobacteria bacterium]MCP5458315.1 transcriptional repressor [Gammaproteobacteria bacterium]
MSEQHIQLLKKYRLSLTPVRLAVLAAIEAHPHSDADTIFQTVKERLSTASKQAIYHNLNTLVKHGIIRELKPLGKPSLYEARRDHHHHIVCKTCGAVMDTDCSVDSEPCLTPAEKHGFLIDEAEVIFWGLCPSCQKPNPSGGKTDE